MPSPSEIARQDEDYETASTPIGDGTTTLHWLQAERERLILENRALKAYYDAGKDEDLAMTAKAAANTQDEVYAALKALGEAYKRKIEAQEQYFKAIEGN